MEHVISQNIPAFSLETYSRSSSVKTSLAARFSSWLNRQEENRFLWLGIALIGGIGAMLPLTLMAIVFLAANNFTLWIIAMTVNVPVLITNLSAQSVKVTVSVLLFSWLVNIIIIAYCAIVFFAV